jgi:phosphoenolpyruvate carboxykinase (ATP)
VPVSFPGVPDKTLNPRATWADAAAYDNQAEDLAQRFTKNFEKYRDAVSY